MLLFYEEINFSLKITSRQQEIVIAANCLGLSIKINEKEHCLEDTARWFLLSLSPIEEYKARANSLYQLEFLRGFFLRSARAPHLRE